MKLYQYKMKPIDPNASAFPSQDNISIVVHGCDCDEDKAIELLQVRLKSASITIKHTKN